VSLELFQYNARSNDGEMVRGTVAAESPAAAALQLQRRALFVTALGKASRSGRLRVFRRSDGLHAFFRAFAVLLSAGIAIRRALMVAIECTKIPALREALRGVLADVEHGSSLSQAMSRRPSDFPSLHTALIAAGETGGVLDDVLARISEVLDREHAVRRKLQAALVYPIVVACGAGALVIFLLVRVLPVFAEMFGRLGVDLPAPTRFLLWLGAVVVSPKAALFALGLSVIMIVGSTMRRMWLAERAEAAALSFPFLGNLLRLTIAARVVRILGLLLRSGVGILNALDVVAPVSGSRRYGAQLRAMAEKLQSGDSIHSAMTHADLFDPLTLALAAVGEEAGSLDEMLLSAAEYLDVEVETRLMALTSLLEPALIAFLGLVVAAIVFSIFLPLYSLIGSIS
jgi:type IV pilus assembly protein PilC